MGICLGGGVYEALLPKFEGVYKIFLLYTSWLGAENSELVADMLYLMQF